MGEWWSLVSAMVGWIWVGGVITTPRRFGLVGWVWGGAWWVGAGGWWCGWWSGGSSLGW